LRMTTVLEGNAENLRQFETALAVLPVISATDVLPPSASITSEVELSCTMVEAYIPRILDIQAPRGFLGEKIWNGANSGSMRNPKPDSNEAVAERLRLLRQVVSGENQTAFAARLGIEVKRWNNFERATPLSKEVAFLIVKKFPNVTLDWLWLGIDGGLPSRFQRELAEAGKAAQGRPRNPGRVPAKTPPQGS
jgi:hypothetical protein